MAPISKKKTSELWKFFEPVGEYYAMCSMCKCKFSYKTSTSNLKKHIQSKHPTVTIPKPARETSSQNKKGSDKSYSSEEGEEITEAIVDNDDGTEPDASRSAVPLSFAEKSTSHEQSTSARREKPVKKKSTDQRCEEIYSLIKSVHPERRCAQPDDFDIFGEIVARKLRNLPTRYAQITLEHKINNLLYEAELGKYNEPPQTSHEH